MPLAWQRSDALAALGRADRRFRRAFAAHGADGPPPPRRIDPFAYLLRAIVFQQISGHAARAIHGRVVALFPQRRPTAARLLELDDATLRAAGLSAGKVRSARDLAEKRLARVVPSRGRLEAMPDEEILARLTAVRGVGPWTVQMLLIFSLDRPDVLPDTDLGVRRGYARLFGLDELPSPAALREHGERWRPWRSMASWYLWRCADDTPLP